jgi:Carboxypeptidase regulatory-like domain
VSRRWALLLACAGVAACADRNGLEGAALPCNAQSQCHDGQTCFLGACRGAASSLRTVALEVRPPSDSPYGLSQAASLDLGKTLLNDAAVLPLLPVAGAVVQGSASGQSAPVPYASLVFTAEQTAIPGRTPTVTLSTDAGGGFATHLPALTWDVAVLPPGALPLLRENLGLSQPNESLTLSLPQAGALVRVQGVLTAGGVPLAGAGVLPLDVNGNGLGAATSTDSGGAFSLLLPPSTASFYLRVAPPASQQPGAPPVPSFVPGQPFQPSLYLSVDVGALPLPATLSGAVVDAQGKPVAGARVYATSLDAVTWTLSRSTTSSESGAFSLGLREGLYAVEAVPGTGAGDPAISGEQQVLVSASATSTVTLSCPVKVAVSGQVLRPDGRPVGAGAQITATRGVDRFVSGRTAQVQATDATGAFQFVGDAGRYLFDIAPPRELELPHRQVLVEVAQAQQGGRLPALVLWPGAEAVGTVRVKSTGAVVPGATVEFFAAYRGGLQVLSLGSAVADDAGRYKVVLPDVADPTDLSQ